MSTNSDYDKSRVQAVQGKAVKVSKGRVGKVVNSYVLGDLLTLYVRVGDDGDKLGTTLWVEEPDAEFVEDES